MNQKKEFIYNTFRIAAYADRYAAIGNAEDANRWAEEIKKNAYAFYIVGGGSNVLFTEDFAGVILHPSDTSLTIVEESPTQVVIRVGAGKNWDELVAFTCDRGWWGMENLSGIPGNVGASPVQNIGAYGGSCSDTLQRVHTFDLVEQKEEWFDADELGLGYRWSKFKRQFAGRKVILGAEFSLSKEPRPRTSYGRLPEILNGTSELTSHDVRSAVLKIRGDKLPHVDEIGSAGSFFKNPELSPDAFNQLKGHFPEIPSYDGANGRIKVPAGWIIEHCGWKGRRLGNVQIYPKQALIIVNAGNADGKEIDDFANAVTNDIYQQCGVRLEREVNTVRPYRMGDFA